MRVLLLMVMVVCLASATPLWAQESEPQPLMDMLALIPDTSAVRAYGVSYMDYAGIVAARPGAPEIGSWAQYDELDNSDDPSDQNALGLWIAAMMGISSGPPDLPQTILSGRDEMAAAVGFSFLDIDRGATFLSPPETVSLLQGDFDLEAITEAHLDRDYSSQDLDGMTLLCGPDGCDSGVMMDLENRNPANPFGGRLGQNRPVLLLPGTVISTTNDTLLTNYPAFVDGLFPMLADAPDYRAAVRAITSTGTLIQAHFYDPTMFPPQDPALALLDPEMTDEERDAVIEDLREQIQSGEQDTLPFYSLVTFADIVDGEEQLTLIGLVFADAKTAQVAADVLANRITDYESVVFRKPLSELFADREIVMGEPELVGDWETGLVTVVLSLRGAMPPQEPDRERPMFTQSSMVFRLFIQMLYQRDLPWLAVGG